MRYKEKNDYNLNIPRYIDSSITEGIQNIDGHLNGGIPSVDVDSLSLYWQTFPKLQKSLFKPLRKGFFSLAVENEAIRDTIYDDVDFSAYADKVETAFNNWKAQVDKKLKTISGKTKPKHFITEIAECILKEYDSITLVDKYDAYEVLLSYWNETMSDDVYLLIQDGYKTIREAPDIRETIKSGKDKGKKRVIGWDGKLVPKTLVIEMFFSLEQKIINDTEVVIAAAQAELDEKIENSEEDSVVKDILKENGSLDKTELKAKLKDETLEKDDRQILQSFSDLVTRADERKKTLKDLCIALDEKIRGHYAKLTNAQCLELLIERKWYRSLFCGFLALYTAVNHRITDRVIELADCYGQTLPTLESEVAELEAKAKSHLEEMGFVW
jgi:type I restriction enzyme M protein